MNYIVSMEQRIMFKLCQCRNIGSLNTTRQKKTYCIHHYYQCMEENKTVGFKNLNISENDIRIEIDLCTKEQMSLVSADLKEEFDKITIELLKLHFQIICICSATHLIWVNN